MAIKTYRPITPTLRFKTTQVNDDLTTDKPHKPLLAVKQRTGGRRNQGDLTIRHQGGGHKQKLRLIDFKRDKFGVPGKVATIEYDPNRSARIALIHYLDGEKRYILRSRGRHPGGQCLATQEHSLRHDGSCY
jgi:large subunit ribosomal protein L2